MPEKVPEKRPEKVPENGTENLKSLPRKLCFIIFSIEFNESRSIKESLNGFLEAPRVISILSAHHTFQNEPPTLMYQKTNSLKNYVLSRFSLFLRCVEVSESYGMDF